MKNNLHLQLFFFVGMGFKIFFKEGAISFFRRGGEKGVQYPVEEADFGDGFNVFVPKLFLSITIMFIP